VYFACKYAGHSEEKPWSRLLHPALNLQSQII